jgi:hypothetical protein
MLVSIKGISEGMCLNFRRVASQLLGKVDKIIEACAKISSGLFVTGILIGATVPLTVRF